MSTSPTTASDDRPQRGRLRLGRLFRGNSDSELEKSGLSKWTMGMLNDRETVEVPGKCTWRPRPLSVPFRLISYSHSF